MYYVNLNNCRLLIIVLFFYNNKDNVFYFILFFVIIHTYIHTYTYIHNNNIIIYIHTYIIIVLLYTYIHTYIHTCIHTYIHVRTYVRACVIHTYNVFCKFICWGTITLLGVCNKNCFEVIWQCWFEIFLLKYQHLIWCMFEILDPCSHLSFKPPTIVLSWSRTDLWYRIQ